MTFLDPSQKLQEIQEETDRDFQDSLLQSAAAIFGQQLGVVMAQIITLNSEDAADRLKIMDLLRPYEGLANDLRIHEDEGWREEMGEKWRTLWEAYHKAEQGDATDFIQSIRHLQEDWNTPVEPPPN